MILSFFRGKVIPMGISLLCLIVIIADYFIKQPQLDLAGSTLITWGSIAMTVAMGLALVTLTLQHSTYVYKRTPERWFYSVVLIIAMYVTIITGLIGQVGNAPSYLWILKYIKVPADTVIYALTGFYIFTAMYRAFKVRSLEVVFLMVATVAVLLMNTSAVITFIPGLYDVGQWFMNVAGVGGNRAFMIGSAIGAVMLGIRMLLGVEKAYLRGAGEEGA